MRANRAITAKAEHFRRLPVLMGQQREACPMKSTADLTFHGNVIAPIRRAITFGGILTAILLAPAAAERFSTPQTAPVPVAVDSSRLVAVSERINDAWSVQAEHDGVIASMPSPRVLASAGRRAPASSVR
jgi:hypothetical protein